MRIGDCWYGKWELQGQGLTIPQLSKRLGISDQTFYRWRLKYGALKEDKAQRLKALEQENARLWTAVSLHWKTTSSKNEPCRATRNRGGVFDPHRLSLRERTA
jgi:transposase-like protein